MSSDRADTGHRERRADAERNRQAIVAAALHAFARRPEASLDEVAHAAGLTRTTIYRHFPNREALVAAVYLAALEGLSSAIEHAHLDRGPVPAGFQRAADAVLTTSDEYTVLVNGPATDLNDERLTNRYDAALAPVVALARRGQDTGELNAELPAWWIADSLFALLLAALIRVGDGILEAGEVVPLVLTAFWDGAAAPDPR